MAGTIYLLELLFLLCLLLPAVAQAESAWFAQSSDYLQQLLKNNPQRLAELDAPVLRIFYKEREYKPLWSDEKGRLNRAYDLLQAILNAGDEGLSPADYLVDEIRESWQTTGVDESIRLDLLLTVALYRYSNHVYFGRSKPADIDPDWHIQNEALDMAGLLGNVARKKSIVDVLKALPPQHAGYQSLKKELSRYRDIERQGGWQRFDKGPTLQPGTQHAQVVQLRQRLRITGDLSAGADTDIFDHGLAEAVKSYQQRQGIMVDGDVGPQTRRSLNIPVSVRILQIRINMERWRWMPRKLGKRYLMVNMTGFELYFIENASVALSMPVIVGKSYRATPSFTGLVSTMEYNPYWTIPTNLVIQDIIPHQLSDSSYLKRKSIKVYSGWKDAREIDPETVNWKQLDKEKFPYWLRQEPGPKNALGQVKFLFSNPYEIYLHGTPDRYLFDREVRAFSSGCIRVKDPVRLSSYLLNDGSQQGEEEILANIHLGTNQSIRLPAAVRIYLVYWTAWVDQQGRLNFRHDIYRRDAALNSAFAKDTLDY
ncbi:MAG: L,D-transpeptidase family protein [Gammaproteobacteria bacterium]|nr:L,D-transpeptidase family protein [Gammaproteobacteria bacterium]